MENVHRLDPDLQNVYDVLAAYQRERLFQVQDRRGSRHSAALYADYSLSRLLGALGADSGARRHAPFELAESDRIAERVGRQPRPGYAFVPVSDAMLYGARDLTAAVASAGGYLVGAETAPGDLFVATLRAASVVEQLGIRRIPMVGQAAVPQGAGGITTSWLPTEGSVITESTHAFKAAAGTPKTLGAYCEASGQLMKQSSPAAQAFVLSEMAAAMAEDLSAKVINGSGASGQPTGILQTSGIGSQTGTSLAWSGIIDAIEDVETSKGFVSPAAAAWAIDPASAKILRGRERATGSGFIMEGNTIAGYRALSTAGVPSDTTLFGDWSRVVLLEWGALELGADPYGINSALFTKGLVGLRALWSVDVIVLQPAAFTKITSIT